MTEAVKFLEANPEQCLAAVGRDRKAKCRPFYQKASPVFHRASFFTRDRISSFEAA